jgi:hypothetical protein
MVEGCPSLCRGDSGPLERLSDAGVFMRRVCHTVQELYKLRSTS